MLLLLVLNFLPVDFSGESRQRLLGGITLWLGLMYAVVPAALIWWAWQRRRQFQSPVTCEPAGMADTRKRKRFVLWVAVAMIGTACLLGLVLADSNKKVRHITTTEVQKMVTDGKGKEAEFSVLQFRDGSSNIWVMLRENGKRVCFSAPVEDGTLALLKKEGIKCPTYVSGRDFEVFGWPGRLLPLFCLFILAIGGVLLLRRPGRFYPRQGDAEQIRKMQQVDKLANKVFGTSVALVLIAVAILLGVMTRWGIRTISGAEARQIIAEKEGVRCEVFHFNDGTKELWLTLRGSRLHPEFIAPVDEPTLALLAVNRISHKTYVQGRDFGFRGPTRRFSLLCIPLLAAGAAFVLRWAWKKKHEFPPVVASSP